eukprot:TRINITY_DN791_c0_g2_i1.p1 TRINITY_DN791_c0_g2~~TRINITY_DN791_c0_g2_i1.p1  ORF type:complete len:218 (-),score=57.03 TRINITY_DN791_c0_g2_i1:674-1327(-)
MMEGILFAEFDHIVGPKISWQIGRKEGKEENLVTSEIFEAIHEYIITKPNLCGRLMKLNEFGLQIMGFPILLEDSKYPRNYFLFNLCFIFQSNATGHHSSSSLSSVYEKNLRKLAHLLKSIEKEREFVSNAETRPQFYEMLEQIFFQLNKNGECSIQLDHANIITMRLIPNLPLLLSIGEHDVPVIIQDLDPQIAKDWDLSVQQVIFYSYSNESTIS